ncbi:hypothetical protein HYH03_017139 [Edaphochlamys debaryana]|uniref:Cyanobacterial aminoacyl-tRNA synthetase CAAD domain-containing protein n=1 Tax=Edaphochlamys debaryana TaxID=47281 RepID=A0A835XIH7_9CHLO|nr:hypothetical protein HYH03_017139 [Edaphochlamys debaryana]|eukprot:KAG2484049.1 hypothetical protein HYH03_017139 [Edaphochlamys debaryana]
MAKLQSSANEAVAWVKARWEATSDSEKPAAIAIIIGVIVAQIAIGATIDVVDRIPVVSDLLELLGLAVTLYWTYRLTTDEDERDNVKTTVSGFLDKVTGSK